MQLELMAVETFGGTPTISAMEAKLWDLINGSDGGNVEGWDVSSVREGARADTREWRYAWRRLKALTADKDLEALDEETGEVWQYMGVGSFEGTWVHSFRHRHHPILKRRWYVNVPVTTKFLASITS